MDILGSIGQLYTFILLVLLFLGSGLAVWAMINSIMKNKDKMNENIKIKLESIKNNKIIGGFHMKNNNFIKLAVFSFIGIIISAAILTALPNTNSMNNANNMNMQYGTNGMYTQTSMNGQAMNMQGMANTNMQSNTNTGYYDANSIQQQLYNMQQQLNQMQNQINNSMSNMQSQGTSGSSNMNSGSSNSSAPMPTDAPMPMM
jgi:hypothetical protein